MLDSRNDETFGGVSRSVIRKPFTNLNTGRVSDEAEVSLRSLSMDSREPVIGHADSSYAEEDREKQALTEQSRASKTMDLCSSLTLRKESSDKAVLSHEATAYDPSHVSIKGQVKESSCNELSEGAVPSKTQGTSTSLAWPSSSALSSYCGGATSISAGHGLSPSSFVGSLPSDKSTLNPHAKEFKLNPNAQSFIPSQTPLRPASPVPDSSFYYRANMAALPQVHGMPVSIGIGPSFTAQQAVVFNPQVAPMLQTYFHPNGPQYGQQMITGQPGQVMYMPTYPPEMPYKGRDF
ncbi:Protein interacting with poly(A)-binding protein [Abeliophyllum distichum]|uniref:Protein interacting with poly(A)-binding protein n=1 Tax=Abeliophyllum distichum TaxID=126358 RepID=A0ABD1VA29_9LAMI